MSDSSQSNVDVINTWSSVFNPLHIFSIFHWDSFSSSNIIMKWVGYLLVNYLLECILTYFLVSTDSECTVMFSDIFQVDQKQKISRNYGFRLNWNLFSVWPIQTISIVILFSYNVWINILFPNTALLMKC